MNLNQKPENPEKYCEWLFNTHKIRIDKRTESNYNHVITRSKQEFEKSVFWSTFLENFPNYRDKYYQNSGYSLFPYADYIPILQTKRYDDFIHKTFRKNCLHNKNYPKPPEKGWIFPGVWYSQINDIIRTSVVVKYLDGIDFILNKIIEICKENQIEYRYDKEVKDAGYYAIHVYIKQSFQIPDLKFNETTRNIEIEIQLTTEIQDIIKKLLHLYYEKQRNLDIKDIEQREKEWRWHYEYDEFSVNYLGHILHYIEGMIMEIRNREERKK
jgi:hypothetical protein